MTEKPSQAPPFKVEWHAPFQFKWRGDAEELCLLLDDDNVRHFARVGIIVPSGTRHCKVEITPQNGAHREMIERYLNQMVPLKIKGRRGFRARRKTQTTPSAVRIKKKPVHAPVLQDNQRVPQVSIEEQERRIQEQANADRLSEIDRLNIFPPGSDEYPCLNIRHGIRCDGNMELEEVRSETYALAFLMWKCLICREVVDKIVLQNRGIKIEDYKEKCKKATRERKKRAVISAEP